MKRRVTVRAVIVKAGKLLCVKLKPYNAAVTGEFWCTVGGGIDSGEPLLPALTREVIEETGVMPVIGNLLYIHQFINGDVESLEFFFHVTNADDFMRVDLAATTHGQVEIAEIDFIDAPSNNVFPTFLKTESFDNLGPNTMSKIFSF